MTYTEIKQRKDRRYYYQVRSVRKGKKIEKERVYLGANLNKQELERAVKKADEKLLAKNVPKQRKRQLIGGSWQWRPNHIVYCFLSAELGKSGIEDWTQKDKTDFLIAERRKLWSYEKLLTIKFQLANRASVGGELRFDNDYFALFGIVDYCISPSKRDRVHARELFVWHNT